MDVISVTYLTYLRLRYYILFIYPDLSFSYEAANVVQTSSCNRHTARSFSLGGKY